MLPFFLYLFAGAITGFHICTLLLATMNGGPVNSLPVIALFGSFCLLIAAYVSLYRPQAAAKIALIAALAMWSFYGPAIANVIRAKLARRSVLSQVTIQQTPFLSKFGYF
jgi:hypothetical protein